MSDKINVEAILEPRLIYNVGDGIPAKPYPKPNMMHINDVKAAIKEVVELVIDKCSAGFLGTEKDVILNVKKEIEYE